MSGQHSAAILPSKGSPIEVVQRATPKPGPTELLIDVKSVALNPIDVYERDMGFAIAAYPAVIGHDIAGVVVSAGSSVPADAPKTGTRVAAAAPVFTKQGAPDYGGMQERALIPAANAVPLPEGMSFNAGSLLPMAVKTVWAGWYKVGLPRFTKFTAADKQGLLVWGGASSVGGAAIQIGRTMGYTVYATASEKHHEYLRGLGASRLFDYKDEDVVEQIIKAAKEDTITIRTGYHAAGRQADRSLEVLEKLKGDTSAKLATAVPLPMALPQGAQVPTDIEVAFAANPTDTDEMTEHFHFVFTDWLKPKLASEEYVPSPKIKVVEGGLEAANFALDELKKGVSGVKLVLEV